MRRILSLSVSLILLLCLSAFAQEAQQNLTLFVAGQPVSSLHSSGAANQRVLEMKLQQMDEERRRLHRNDSELALAPVWS